MYTSHLLPLRLIPFIMGLLGYACTSSLPSNQPPNIIFLLTDDLRFDALGYMGNSYVSTPHLDTLAGESAIFPYAYHVSPICMPSRASLMTGTYLGTHQVGFDHPTRRVLTVEEFQTSYPVLLRKAGYYTGFIGKFGFPVRGDQKVGNQGGDPHEDALPKEDFDEWMGFAHQGAYFPKEEAFNGYNNFSGALHLNEFMGDQALTFVERAKASQKPFCLSVSFKAPHAPFTPEEDMRRLYDTTHIPRMANDTPQAFEKLPKIVQTKSRNAIRYFGQGERYEPVWHLEKDSVYQEFIKNYYGLISGVDRVVGRIRDKLDRLGLTDNTVIIFTSDNGFFCGSRQLTGKALLYDESARAPLIVYDPRNKQLPAEIPHLVSHIDIAPTILTFGGIDLPAHMPGIPLHDVMNSPQSSSREAVFGENNFANWQPIASEAPNPQAYQSMRSRFVRTSQFKYIRYYESSPLLEELWDMEKDPGETLNLVDDPTYERVLEEMRNRLNAFEDSFVLHK